MIFDGPKAFPNSCVLYHRYRHYGLREAFAYLRAREEIRQFELAKAPRKSLEAHDAKIRLEEVEAILIYIAGNIETELEPTQLSLPGFELKDKGGRTIETHDSKKRLKELETVLVYVAGKAQAAGAAVQPGLPGFELEN